MAVNSTELANALRQRTAALTVTEVARLLQVSPETIYRQVRRGLLPALRIGDLIRFDPQQFADWLAAQQQSGGTPCNK
jgi:excisionase family DNA binding protein